MLNGGTANLEAVVCGVFALRQCIDNQIYPALLNHLNDIGAALMHLADNLRIDTHGTNCLCCTFGCNKVEADVIEGLGQLLHFFLVLVSYSDEDAAMDRDIHAGTEHCLVEGPGVVIVDAH